MLRELALRAGATPPPLPEPLDFDQVGQEFLDYGEAYLWGEDAAPIDNNAIAMATLAPDMPVILPPSS